MPTIITIIIAVVAFIVAAVITRFLTISSLTKDADSKIGSAETRAREIIDDALKTAETTKKEALLEVKEESIKTKNELEKETKERRSELQRYEKRVLSKEEALDKRSEAIEQREANFTAREEQIKQREAKVEELNQQRVQELERISGLTSEQAKDYLLKTVEDDVKHDTARMIKELETQAKEEAAKKAREYVVTAIQKCAADHVAETTISVVQLPSDEMKGRIIGREGRNIRTLETMTGVELIIDDTPESLRESGNSVGKSTAIKIIDLCLGAKSVRELYYDSDTRSENVVVKDFLEEYKVQAELILIDENKREYSIKRDLYSSKKSSRKN